jgi:hypothetical protein
MVPKRIGNGKNGPINAAAAAPLPLMAKKQRNCTKISACLPRLAHGFHAKYGRTHFRDHLTPEGSFKWIG